MAFAMAHSREDIAREPQVLQQLASAVHRRHEALRHTSGLNAEVFRRTCSDVCGLMGGRTKRLIRLGGHIFLFDKYFV